MSSWLISFSTSLGVQSLYMKLILESTQCFWTKCIPTLIGLKSSATHMSLVAFSFFFKKLIKNLAIPYISGK